MGEDKPSFGDWNEWGRKVIGVLEEHASKLDSIIEKLNSNIGRVEFEETCKRIMLLNEELKVKLSSVVTNLSLSDKAFMLLDQLFKTHLEKEKSKWDWLKPVGIAIGAVGGTLGILKILGVL